MSNNLGTLTIDLALKLSNYTDGLDKAGRATKKMADESARNFAIAKTAAAGFATAAVYEMAQQVKASIEHSAALYDQAQALNFSTEALSIYEYGLAQSDVSLDQLTTSLNKFNKQVATDSDAFKKLGIDIHDSNGILKANAVLIDEVADKFQDMGASAMRSKIAQDLFGKSGAALIPWLSTGSEGFAQMAKEADNFNQIISSETAALADEYGDNLQKMKDAGEGFSNAIAAGALPALVEFTDGINDPQIQSGMNNFNSGLETLVGWLAEIPGLVKDFNLGTIGLAMNTFDFGISALGDDPAAPGTMTGSVDRSNPAGDIDLEALEAGDKLIAQYEKQIALIGKTSELSKLQAEIQLGMYEDVTAAVLEEAMAKASLLDSEAAYHEASQKGLQDTIAAQEAEAARFRAVQEGFAATQELLEREIATYGLITDEAIFRKEVELGLYKEMDAASVERRTALYHELDALKANTEQMVDIKAAQENYEALVASLQEQIALTGEVTELEEFRYEVAHGGYKELEADQIAFVEGLLIQRDSMEANAKAAEEHFKKLEEVSLEVARNTQNILADFLFDPFKDGVEGMVEDFGKMLWKLETQALAADIMEKVWGMSDSNNGWLSAIGDMFGGQASKGKAAGIVGGEWDLIPRGKAGGNGWDESPFDEDRIGGLMKLFNSFAGFFDTGGSIGAGEWGVAGEKGAEIIRGPGQIISRADTAAIMGGERSVTNHYNIVLPNVRTKEEGSQAGSAAARQINRMNSSSSRYQ